MDSKYIRVWRFHDAPEELKNYDNGGDEDWLAHVPAEMANDYIPWLEGGSAFGVCDINEYKQADGSVVYIGCHA